MQVDTFLLVKCLRYIFPNSRCERLSPWVSRLSSRQVHIYIHDEQVYRAEDADDLSLKNIKIMDYYSEVGLKINFNKSD